MWGGRRWTDGGGGGGVYGCSYKPDTRLLSAEPLRIKSLSSIPSPNPPMSDV